VISTKNAFYRDAHGLGEPANIVSFFNDLRYRSEIE